MLLVTFWLISLLTCIHWNASEAVYSVDTTKFATKNSYASSSTDIERQQGRATLNVINKYCNALQVTSVLRHGTRNPTSGDITQINNVLKKMQSANSSHAWIQELADVAKMFPIHTEGDLVEAGGLEHQGIGYRLGEVYSTLFGSSEPGRLSFSSTSKSRTKDSCKAFQSGFFRQQDIQRNFTIRNDVLRFYDRCGAYEILQDGLLDEEEYRKFQNISFPSISQRYAFTLKIPSINITFDEMEAIYQIAGIEFAVFGSTHWSKFIHPEDLLKLEYSVDLESYYEVGYGFPLNYEMSCPLMSEIFLEMDKVFTQSSYLTGNFYFGHSATVVPLMGLLGLFKDTEPLTAHNYDRMHRRAYKTGRNDPFSTSVSLVQYNCNVTQIMANKGSIPTEIFPESPEQNMTLLLIKEQPVKLPLCSHFLCPYSKIRKFYSPNIDNCNFNAMCQNSAIPSIGGQRFWLSLMNLIGVTWITSKL